MRIQDTSKIVGQKAVTGGHGVGGRSAEGTAPQNVTWPQLADGKVAEQALPVFSTLSKR